MISKENSSILILMFGVIGKVLTEVLLVLVLYPSPIPWWLLLPDARGKAETIYFKTKILTVAFPFDIFPSFPLSSSKLALAWLALTLAVALQPSNMEEEIEMKRYHLHLSTIGKDIH